MAIVVRLGQGNEDPAVQAVAALRPAGPEEGARPSPGQLARFLADGRNYFILARDENEPVGFLTAYELECYDRDGSMVYLYEIGVAPRRRRQGIGRAMAERVHLGPRTRMMITR